MFEFTQCRLVQRAPSRRIDEDQVGRLSQPEHARKVFAGQGDINGKAEDAAVYAQLLDGCDAIGVQGDQGDVSFLPKRVKCGELGDGRRLPHAARSYDHDRLRSCFFIQQGTGNLHSSDHEIEDRGPQRHGQLLVVDRGPVV